MNQTKWWKNAVVYQIYPKSFQDTTGSGIGDLNGIISRLDYLEELGINVIWMCPVCKSPQEDNGYDISDYRDIDPLFGNLSDMERLITEAGKRNIRIMLDLVLNHCSDEHPWFIEAKRSRENPYHDYFVWRDGVEGIVPNDMRATFGGSAWEWVPEVKQYYFHQFAIKQPDLNWENPRVRQEIYDMILYWMDKGVGGFRMDVIDQIAKEPDLKITANGPRLHEFLQELSRETFQKGDLITVGEAWGANLDNTKLYSNPDGSEFSMVFQFEHIGLDQVPGGAKWDIVPLSLVALKQVFAKWQKGLAGCGWNSLFWDNHDLPRIVSRWGNDSKEYRELSAKMLATILHGMKGTPYVYQGEELGMTNVQFPIEEYRDVELINMYNERLAEGYSMDYVMDSIYKKGRDNARTPMQWDESDNAGFTTGTPWIKVNPNYTEINAASQINNPDSIFHYYKKLIALRKEYDIFVEGENFDLWYEYDEDIFAYTRTLGNQTLLVLCNFYGKERELEVVIPEHAKLLIANYKEGHTVKRLRPYEAMMWLY